MKKDNRKRGTECGDPDCPCTITRKAMQNRKDGDELFLVGGGQGRSAEDLERDAMGAAGVFGIVVVAGVAWGIVWLVLRAGGVL
jgi:hypothetical protein